MPSVPSLLLIALITFTVQYFQTVFAISDVAKRYKIHRGSSMVSNAVISEIQTTNEFECVYECRFHPSCLSVNVAKSNVTGFHCTLFNATAADHDVVVRKKDGDTYIELVPKEPEENEDCETKRNRGGQSGVYPLRRMNGETITTFCDMTTGTGGWTMLQRRMDGSVDFYRGWQDYKKGFGDLHGEFWLGLDQIHTLTASDNYILRFDLWDDAEHRFAEHTSFTVGSAAQKFKLGYANYNGTAGDTLGYLKGRSFSTLDQDNDWAGYHCAETHKGAWWHRSCHLGSNINGLYLNGSTTQTNKGMLWSPFRGRNYSLLRTEMKIKRM